MIQIYHFTFASEMYFPTNTSRVFYVKTTWKRPFACRFNVEYMWCICRIRALLNIFDGALLQKQLSSFNNELFWQKVPILDKFLRMAMFIDLKILENMINSVNMNKDTKSNLFTWDHFYRSCKHLIYCPNLVHFHDCMSSFFSFSFFHRSYTEFTNHRLTLNEFLNKSTHRFLCCSFAARFFFFASVFLSLGPSLEASARLARLLLAGVVHV